MPLKQKRGTAPKVRRTPFESPFGTKSAESERLCGDGQKHTLILTMNIHHENFHDYKLLKFQSILTMIITQKPFST